MEVHHHPDLHHRRKKFKEYFLEFLMIFMAVTLGFLAESLRENISDKNKEKEYIASFINNLKDDTAQFNEVLRENDAKIDTLRKLILLSRGNLADTGIRRAIYRDIGRAVGYYSVFKSNDATMMQLKNSGGLRLIRRDHVADSIAQYDSQVKAIYGAEEMYMTSSDAAESATQEVLDYTIYTDTAYWRNGHLAKALLPFLSDDPKKIRWMFNKIEYEVGGTQNYLTNIRERLPSINRLIHYLQREYDIE
ncbi:MAG TPA: hypothetical protein VNU72_02800 [Puia sp.]|nr:hypothetical protein [Puia sp.]